MGFKKGIFGIFLSAAVTACSPVGTAPAAVLQSSSQLGLEPLTPDQPEEETGGGEEVWQGLKICSELDFEDVEWSKNVEVDDRDAFALALNISGSFEGHRGWANLTNNFDGQGLSMGLLNQNLGQGSLQPMWIEMRNGDLSAMQKLFSSSNFKSVASMLSKWEAATKTDSLDIKDYGYNELDDPSVVAEDLGIDPLELQQITVALTSRNQASVDWAKANLYSGSSFKSDWSTQLNALANSPEYRSIQVRKAESLHNQALAMMKSYGLHELRSYLFFFDIAVQNGGISTTLKNKYLVWAKTNSKASEYTKLMKILELRLTAVRSQYVNDVRSRKASIINGSGTVHGAKRDYAKEFCTPLTKTI
jgi:hypothetical protein